MNNLLSYCGLVDGRRSASDKDLPLCLFFVNFAHYFLNLHESSWQTFLAKPETEMSKMRTQKTRGWLCSEGSQVFAIVKRYRLPIFCQMTELHFCFFNFALFLKIAHKNSSKMYRTKGAFFSESEIRFSNLPISQKNDSKKLSWAWNLN